MITFPGTADQFVEIPAARGGRIPPRTTPFAEPAPEVTTTSTAINTAARATDSFLPLTRTTLLSQTALVYQGPGQRAGLDNKTRVLPCQEASPLTPDRYRPRKVGWRFCANAAAASRWSSVSAVRRW